MLSVRHNPFVRKAAARAKSIRRFVDRTRSSAGDFESNPPLLCNSFPKSGTHLLLPVLQALPGKLHYGSFIASVPPISFRRRSSRSISRHISAIAPGEVVPAHLYYSTDTLLSLSGKKCVKFFIYRDLRDVALSEAHYLFRMAWWHRLHRHFKAATSDIDRLRLSVRGCEELFPDYPNIGKRFSFYKGWLNCPDTCAVRFEDLAGEHQNQTIRRIITFYSEQTNREMDIDMILDDALQRIRPEASHTFHRGVTGRGAAVVSEELATEFQEVAGSLMNELGYI